MVGANECAALISISIKQQISRSSQATPPLIVSQWLISHPLPVPLLANLTNGNNYLPSIATTQANLLALHQSAAASSLAGNALDYNRSAVASKLCQLAGAGPMELQSLTEDLDAYVSNAQNADLPLTNATSNMRKLANDPRADDNLDKNYATLSHMYNMGVQSQNLLMMPGMLNMIRESSIVPTLPSPYHALLSHQLPAQPSPSASVGKPTDLEASPTTSTNSSASLTKETITCKSCVLIPPNPGAPTPTTRERPMGCRTVFVGGLPENITEDIIREVFDRCGEMTTLRLSKKNFCHIRYVFEASVDSAIYLSGYRIRIDNQSDAANCGRLHVDFAQARDDQYDHECK